MWYNNQGKGVSEGKCGKMPVYQYRKKASAKGCEACAEVFEVVQRMSDARLRKCPKCGGPVERVISLCTVNTRQSDRSRLSDANLKRHGFSKLVNEGGGKFRKTV